jgi:jasmonate ZIM domain-containing protein
MAAAGNNTRFAVTCGLLRQYMREQQHLAGAFRLPPPLVVETTTTMEKGDEDTPDGRTMQLFPTRAGTSLQHPSQER